MKIKILTLGCKANKSDSESIAHELAGAGFEITDIEEEADGFIVNTCAVTSESCRKSRQLIRKIHASYPDRPVIASGCYAATEPSELESLDALSLVSAGGPNELANQLAGMFAQRLEREAKAPQAGSFINASGMHRINIKVQDGCNEFCSYCIIPYARGRSRSSSFAEVLDQAKEIEKAGIHEILLTGIHLMSYSDGGKGLADLVGFIGKNCGIERIRIGSIDPRVLTESFLSQLQTASAFCRHFHVSLQSGSDRILSAMNRKYTIESYLDSLARTRSAFPDACFTTDVIAGFPGETLEDLEGTREAIRKAGFIGAHVFPFSARKGTKAASMRGQLSNQEKKERVASLMDVAVEVSRKEKARFDGAREAVLFEGKDASGQWEGFTRNYLRVKANDIRQLAGRIQECRLTLAEGGEMLAIPTNGG